MSYPITGADGAAITSTTNPLPVVNMGGGSIGVAVGATLSTVAVNVAAVQLKASNVNRKGLSIANNSAVAILYVKFAALASPPTTTDFQYALPPTVAGIPSILEVPFGYTGEVCGIWSAADAAGAAKIAEFT